MSVTHGPGDADNLDAGRQRPQRLDAWARDARGVQSLPRTGYGVNHRRLKFICFGYGHEYRDLRGLWDCVEEHLGEGI